MKKFIALIVLATSLSLFGCGQKAESTASATNISADLSMSERIDVIASLMGTIRNYEPGLQIPEDQNKFTIAKVDGHYNLAVTATRPDGSNAMIMYWVDLAEDNKYSVHYFSVKDDVYVDDGSLDE